LTQRSVPMDLSGLIQVAPIVFVQKKPHPIKTRSRVNSRPIILHSTSSGFARNRNRTKRRRIRTQSAKCAQSEPNASETSSTLSLNSEPHKIEEAHSDGKLFDFKQKTAHRVKLQKRKLRNDERLDLRIIADAKRRRMDDNETAKLAMESAQKRVTQRQNKRDEDSDRLSDFVREERENYRRKQMERDRLKIREQQRRARIYALNYLCRKKYELMCQQNEDVTEQTTKADSERELEED